MGKHKDKTESVRINRELMDQVRSIAKERGAMVSWMANKAIAEWLKWFTESYNPDRGKKP